MQNVSPSAKAALERYAKITTYVYVNDVKQTADFASVTHTASCGDAGSWSIGSATAAQVSIRTDADIASSGDALRVTWSVDGTEYPLFSGIVDSADNNEIIAYDALFGATATAYTPATAATTAADVLALLGIPVENGTASRAAGISFPDGTAALGDSMSLAGAIGAVAMLMGGNARVNRAGELEVVSYNTASGLYDTYDGSRKIQKTPFSVSGIALVAGESVYYAGTAPYLGLSNPLGTQELANAIYATLNGMHEFYGGSAELPAALLIEPGDQIMVADGAYVFVSSVTHSIDGGCRSAVTSVANVTSGDGGSISQAIRTLEADVARIGRLSADYIRTEQLETPGGVNINGNNITAGTINAEHIGVIGGFKLDPGYMSSIGDYENEGGFLVDTAIWLESALEAPPKMVFESKGSPVVEYPTRAELTVGGGGTRSTGTSAFDWVQLSTEDMRNSDITSLKLWNKNRLAELDCSTFKVSGETELASTLKVGGLLTLSSVVGPLFQNLGTVAANGTTSFTTAGTAFILAVIRPGSANLTGLYFISGSTVSAIISGSQLTVTFAGNERELRIQNAHASATTTAYILRIN